MFKLYETQIYVFFFFLFQITQIFSVWRRLKVFLPLYSLLWACILILFHHCRGSATKYIRHPLCTRKINEEWFVMSSFFVLIWCVAQRWDMIYVFYCLPSLYASDSFFNVLTSLLGFFGLQCSVIKTLSFTGQCCWLPYSCPGLQLNQFWGTCYKITAVTSCSLFFGSNVCSCCLKIY